MHFVDDQPLYFLSGMFPFLGIYDLRTFSLYFKAFIFSTFSLHHLFRSFAYALHSGSISPIL